VLFGKDVGDDELAGGEDSHEQHDETVVVL
jgi:hypothetical protein